MHTTHRLLIMSFRMHVCHKMFFFLHIYCVWITVARDGMPFLAASRLVQCLSCTSLVHCGAAQSRKYHIFSLLAPSLNQMWHNISYFSLSPKPYSISTFKLWKQTIKTDKKKVESCWFYLCLNFSWTFQDTISFGASWRAWHGFVFRLSATADRELSCQQLKQWRSLISSNWLIPINNCSTF